MTEPRNTQFRSAETSRRGFLRDVLICALGTQRNPSGTDQHPDDRFNRLQSGWETPRLALKGINAVAGGLIAVSIVVLSAAAGLSVLNLSVMFATAAVLQFTKIPAPIVVLVALLAGFVVPLG